MPLSQLQPNLTDMHPTKYFILSRIGQSNGIRCHNNMVQLYTYLVKGYILMMPLSLPMATSDCSTSYANAVG